MLRVLESNNRRPRRPRFFTLSVGAGWEVSFRLMPRVRRAVIDVGTNSVKLLVADVEGERVCPVCEASEQTRLGRGFYQGRQLQAEAIEHTAQAVARFAGEAARLGVSPARVIATSAAREARNREDLLAAVRRASGLAVEVISGDEEARWAFLGVCTDPALRKAPLLIVEVGGGSTQFILGREGAPQFRGSLAVGTVRLLERIQPRDPPSAGDWQRCHQWLETFLRRELWPELNPRLEAFGSGRPWLVSTGGTASILAAMETGARTFDRDRFEQVLLTRTRVGEYQKRLWQLPLRERQSIAGLPANRADVILFGVAILAVTMEMFGLEQLRVSTRGVRFAAVLPPPGTGG